MCVYIHVLRVASFTKANKNTTEKKRDKCCGLRPATTTAIRILCQCLCIYVYVFIYVCVYTRWDRKIKILK